MNWKAVDKANETDYLQLAISHTGDALVEDAPILYALIGIGQQLQKLVGEGALMEEKRPSKQSILLWDAYTAFMEFCKEHDGVLIEASSAYMNIGVTGDGWIGSGDVGDIVEFDFLADVRPSLERYAAEMGKAD